MSGRLRLSVSMIVRDEEAWIDDCLRHVREIADEIVVVDTGSADRTAEIAERRGAQVFSFPWTGSFGDARTAAVRRCSGDWVLWVDADERVRVRDQTLLSGLLADRTRVAYWVLYHRRPGFTANWQVRLFRNDPDLVFEGAIHENFHPSLDRLCRSSGGSIGYAGIVYQHYGYEGDQERKNRRNLPLLIDTAKCRPDLVFARCHLARTYEAFGELALAEEHWCAAVEIVRGRVDLHLGDSFPFTGLVEHRLRLGDDASALTVEGLERFPENLQLVWYRGAQLARETRYEEAILLFERLLDYGRTQLFDHAVGYDRRILDVLPAQALSECRWASGSGSRGVAINPLAAQPAVYHAQRCRLDESPDPALYRL